MSSISFDHILRQYRTLSPHSCTSLSIDSFPPYSTPPSPLPCIRPQFLPLSNNFDLRSHPFHNDSPLNMSPTTSTSSDEISLSSSFLDDLPATRSLFDKFKITQSRLLHLQKDHRLPLQSLVSFFTEGDRRPFVRPPMSIWTVNDNFEPNDIWAIFQSHDDACTALSISHPSITITPALETDLEPFSRLRRVDSVLKNLSTYPGQNLPMSLPTPDKCIQVGIPSFTLNSMETQSDDFVISTNPPNPRTTFRLGDWICNSTNCAAHNFGRNLACRGCGCPRTENQASTMQRQGSCGAPASRLPVSPRFVNSPGHIPMSQSPLPTPVSSPLYSSNGHNVHLGSVPQPNMMGPKSPSPTHPLLTPSGRSFAVGGKVQNISSDPLSPCVMYWPDNESFPDQGQIRPSSLMVIPQPPILNTGNRGPIEHQPGDWICQKCNYLNWRRRKVCQTCFPYAEGNGDSISAAVQAERINLLTSLLTQNQLPLTNGPLSSQAPRSHSMTPPQRGRMFMDNIHQSQAPYRSRSQSNFDLATPYSDSQFIYETSAPRRASPSLFPSLGDPEGCLATHIPAPLLPSFLQDIVQSPTLSSTSTSSADLSPEDYDDGFSSGRSSFGREHIVTNDSSLNLPVSNIWKLNDEETKGIAGFALPNIDVIRSGSHDALLRRSNSP